MYDFNLYICILSQTKHALNKFDYKETKGTMKVQKHWFVWVIYIRGVWEWELGTINELAKTVYDSHENG